MKISIISYIFLTVLCLVSASVWAVPDDQPLIYSKGKTYQVTAIKAKFPAGDHKDLYEFHVINRVLVNFVSGITVENLFTAELPAHCTGLVLLETGPERVLKDHLLHLFPSHYFW